MRQAFHLVLFRPVLAALLITLFSVPVLGNDERPLPTVDLSAEASRDAPNDLASATVYFEDTHTHPAELAQRVNRAIAEAFDQIRSYPDIKASSTGIRTSPVHSRDGRTIDAWRMRSDISLETTNVAALSELLGKLQAGLAIGGLSMQPAPATRDATADLAAQDALRAFQARARSIADALGRDYRIRSLSVNYGGFMPPPYPVMRSAMMAEAASAPVLEGGESRVSVTVTGTIELLD
jgi:predicted secreted protein